MTDRKQKTDKNFRYFVTNRYWVIFIAIFCSVLWGSAFPVLKVTYADMGLQPEDYGSKMLLAGMRFFLAGLILLVVVRLGMKRFVRVEKRLWPAVVFLGILQISLQYFFFYNGLANTSGVKGAVLQSSSIFFLVVIAHFLYKNDRLSWKKVFGLVTGFSGIILVNWGQSFTFDFSLKGEGFLILAGLTSALGTILAKNLSREINPFLLTGWQMIAGSLLLALTGILYNQSYSLSFTYLSGALLLYSALLSAAAFSLWYALLKYNKAGEIAVYRFMIPVSGAILSALFVPGEYLNGKMLGALLLVASGITAVNHDPARK